MSWWVERRLPRSTRRDARAVDLGLDVVWPPTDEPWGVREFHLRHPDGHTFRIGSGLPRRSVPGMPCLAALFALISPRLAIIFLFRSSATS